MNESIVRKHIDAMLRELAEEETDVIGFAGGFIFVEGETSKCDTFWVLYGPEQGVTLNGQPVEPSILAKEICKIVSQKLVEESDDSELFVTGPTTQKGGSA